MERKTGSVSQPPTGIPDSCLLEKISEKSQAALTYIIVEPSAVGPFPLMCAPDNVGLIACTQQSPSHAEPHAISRGHLNSSSDWSAFDQISNGLS